MQSNVVEHPQSGNDELSTANTLTKLKEQISITGEKFLSGDFSARIQITDETDPVSQSICEELNNWLASFESSSDKLISNIQQIAECDFRFDAEKQDYGILKNVHDMMFMTTSNLNETLRQMLEINGSVQNTSQDLAQKNSKLAERTEIQSQSLLGTSESMERLAEKLEINLNNAKRANELSGTANELALKGREAVGNMTVSMHDIEKSASQINGITEMIKEIAFQTNILSLNAAVEAARAGEQGRGFGVVASEVRSLAVRCSDAVREIEHLINESNDLIQKGIGMATDAEQRMSKIVDGVSESSSLMSEISVATKEQNHAILNAKQEMDKLDEINTENKSLVADLTRNISFLDRQSDFLQDAVKVYKVSSREEMQHPVHMSVQKIAIDTATTIGQTFEQAINQRLISMEALFNFDYQAIKNTNPKKFKTQFDDFTDRVLPDIQEPLLQQYEQLVYAGAVDINGYFPTHNKKFAKPLTGNYELDLAQNRTKRIFEDRVGLTCGSHTEPVKLQIYRRDTGELMFDMSAPIFVQGQHWGGFRIGYRIN